MSGIRTLPSSGAAGGPSVRGRAGAARVAPAAERGRRRGALLASGLSLALFGASLGVSFAVTPEDIEARRVVLSPTCHIKAMLGRECPTCGMTRAFSALSHGRVDDALRYNRGAPALYAAWWAAAAAALATFLRSLVGPSESRKIPT
ncbi:MAG TPA: DUF2752 domain-containing protein [Polyangiaceae bacterium]|nr:DUF2752 domain-containing protein [Polyangiaceae bacterium]